MFRCTMAEEKTTKPTFGNTAGREDRCSSTFEFVANEKDPNGFWATSAVMLLEEESLAWSPAMFYSGRVMLLEFGARDAAPAEFQFARAAERVLQTRSGH